MLTRPLDLVSRLRPVPRSFDSLLYISVALVGLQMALFGSRFILSPALPVDFQPVRVPADRGVPTTDRIDVTRTGIIVTEDGLKTLQDLPAWLRQRAAQNREPTLLILLENGVPSDLVLSLNAIAAQAGFKTTFGYNNPAPPRPGLATPSR